MIVHSPASGSHDINVKPQIIFRTYEHKNLTPSEIPTTSHGDSIKCMELLETKPE